jgi:hypothetical protein
MRVADTDTDVLDDGDSGRALAPLGERGVGTAVTLPGPRTTAPVATAGVGAAAFTSPWADRAFGRDALFAAVVGDGTLATGFFAARGLGATFFAVTELGAAFFAEGFTAPWGCRRTLKPIAFACSSMGS